MTAFKWYNCQWPWAYFKVIGLFHIKFLKNGMWYSKSYYRILIGNHTLAFDCCHFWRPWSTFEGHFSLGCHFHVHVCNPWHAFASHGLPAIAELLVLLAQNISHTKEHADRSIFSHRRRERKGRNAVNHLWMKVSLLPSKQMQFRSYEQTARCCSKRNKTTNHEVDHLRWSRD